MKWRIGLKNKKLITGAVISAMCLTAVTGGTLAYFTDHDQRANVVTLGHVTGTLTETGEQKRDNNTTGKDYSNVKPGDVLKKDPTVRLDSTSEDAYVRVKLDFLGLTMEQAAALEDGLDIADGWSRADDGYYYYDTILSNDEGKTTSSTVFTKVTIPTDWGNDEAGITFNINAKAEFIQADNFTPVRDNSGNITGWGDVVIEQSQNK